MREGLGFQTLLFHVPSAAKANGIARPIAARSWALVLSGQWRAIAARGNPKRSPRRASLDLLAQMWIEVVGELTGSPSRC